MITTKNWSVLILSMSPNLKRISMISILPKGISIIFSPLFNFKKNKESSTDKLKSLKDPKKLVIKEMGKSKELVGEAGRVSPKFVSSQGENNFLKSKSIFSVSSFGALNKNIDLKYTQSKNEPMKINFESKKLTLDDRKYNTEKKKTSLPKNIVIKTKSTSKL